MSTSLNRLQHETSPYLQQHARNPVDWHPWDETALQLAREQDKPIFLSIGYLGWFIGPAVFAATTIFVFIVLLRRQFFSAARSAVID